MIHTIKNRYTVEIMHEGEAKSFKGFVKKYKTDLREANLQRADLQRADLRGANLWRADLWEANLQRADLQGANLWRADLQRADLQGAKIDKDQIPNLLKAMGVEVED